MDSDTTHLNILSHEPVGRDAFLLRLERPEWSWRAGEVISIIGEHPVDQREYSIASGENDETLDVLYRLIPSGTLTPWLRQKEVGDRLRIQGPFGRFTLRDISRPVLFCATGTGIAPCRAYWRSHPELNLTVLHGVRSPEDLYFRGEFSGAAYHPFCSREALDGRTGRLTDALRTLDIPESAHVYLCGGNDMIREAEGILTGRGISFRSIFQEPYYEHISY